ncbi:MAG: 16S rRNA methyltransferase [Anaerolineaceae bacterium]|nr:16S rRNA methyltransferase [Anaerolineaceae bacterium]
MPADSDMVNQIVEAVQKGERYRHVHSDLVHRLAAAELAHGRNAKEAVKAVRSKLHQVGGAYLELFFPVGRWFAELPDLPAGLDDPKLQAFCLTAMQHHASTRERLKDLPSFFETILRPLAPIHSVLDLACGLNPLAQPWMPLAPDAVYHACDIYADMLELVRAFQSHIQRAGQVFSCDLTAETPACPAQLAFLLKTIPCLEQLDKEIAAHLLNEIPADHLLVSFPVRSLGGRSKGMLQNYEAHFHDLVAGKNWRIQRFIFSNELAFLISR